MAVISVMIGLPLFVTILLGLGGAGLVTFAVVVWRRFSKKLLLTMFKYSSFYMLGSMILLAFAALR